MIPFCKTDLGKEEKQAVADCIDSGWVVLGPKSEEFEQKFAEYVGAKFALFVDSGTSALFLAMQYLNYLYKPFEGGAEPMTINVPSLTFASSAEVIVNSGNTPYFVDVDKKSFCFDKPRKSEMNLVVHLTGERAKADASIVDSAHRIERDDVKGSDATWCYSFYATKNITTVQGGMIATNNPHTYQWLKLARDHGLTMGTRERYNGKYKQYDVEFVGWRVKGDDLRAVVGLEQLKKLPRLTARRNELVQKYNRAFGYKRNGNHVYPILVKERDWFMDYMMTNEIQCTVHFRPLHTMTAYKDFPHDPLPNTEFIGKHIVSIPLFPRLTNEEQDYIIGKVLASDQLIV